MLRTYVCADVFHKGHKLCTDNWYTNLDLANKLLEKNTHLNGTIRKNRKGIPKEVVLKRLQREQYIAKENKEGITILKWKDRRDVLLLSTKHSTTKTNRFLIKPKIIIDYNKSKTAIDLSDQMSAYNSPLRKSMIWYRRLAFEPLLNTGVLNAFAMYKEVIERRRCT